MSGRSQVEIAWGQIEFARRYSTELIDTVRPEDWFRVPAGGSTHLAWQVGHLAMAEYGLTMLRVRGKQPEDADFISNDFVRLFQKGTMPQSSADSYPPATEIRAVFDRVHAQARRELAEVTDDQLTATVPMPYAVVDTKLGSLFFCALHEMLHAGQIGLLRRLLGYEPIR
jgi:hypothetical protein